MNEDGKYSRRLTQEWKREDIIQKKKAQGEMISYLVGCRDG
jgi:hypothetical protein